jgi:fimbrial chaperone protein
MRTRDVHDGRRFALACVLALACAQVGATGLQVAPTTLTLGLKQNAEGLWLSNTGAETLHAQVRVYAWSQAGGEDHLEPSRSLAISPPMLQLDPGARQLVRVIRVGTPPTHIEAAYRIIVDELPVEASAGTPAPAATGGNSALKFVLRYSVPVFVAADGESAPAPQGRLRRDGPTPVLEVHNDGGIHAQLGNLALIDAQGHRSELVPGLIGYVLPGATMHWPLNAESTFFAHGGHLQSRINGEAIEQTLAPVATP